MSNLHPLPTTPLGRYRHYKGGDYEVIGVARHSETHEPLVVYRPLYDDSGWWVRPHAMFFEAVVVDGVARPRFEKIDDCDRAAAGRPASARCAALVRLARHGFAAGAACALAVAPARHCANSSHRPRRLTAAATSPCPA